MEIKMRRISALILTVFMAMSLLPMTALADGEAAGETEASAEENVTAPAAEEPVEMPTELPAETGAPAEEETTEFVEAKESAENPIEGSTEPEPSAEGVYTIVEEESVAMWEETAICTEDATMASGADVSGESEYIIQGNKELLSWKLTGEGVLILEGSSSIPANFASDCLKEYKDLVQRIRFYSSASKIGACAFADCTNLKSIYLSGYTSAGIDVGNEAFCGCSSLEWVGITNNVSFGDSVFASCEKLHTIYISGDNFGTTFAFTPTQTTFLGVTATIYYPTGTSISSSLKANYGGNLSWQAADYGACGPNSYWFFDNGQKELTISGTGTLSPRSSGSAYPWAVYGDSVEQITILPNIDEIPSYSFEYLSNVKSVNLPEGLVSLAANAFNDCSSLKDLIIPSTVQKFAARCTFNRCDSLTELYYMGTEEEWKQIENYEDAIDSRLTNIEEIYFLTFHEYIEPSCVEPGHIAFYSFEDSAIKTLFDVNKNVIENVDYLPALGHSYTPGETVRENEVSATCTKEGAYDEVVYCSVCGTEISRVTKTTDKLAHTPGEAARENEVSATYTKDGSYDEVVYCSVCGAEISRVTKTIAKLEQPEMPFTDVYETDYYYDAVIWATENDITNGTTETTFSPQKSCTRAQMVTILWRAAGEPEPAGTANAFTDVKAGAYYAKAVQWAVEKKITLGTSATTFSPNAAVTRGQVVTFLYRYCGEPEAAAAHSFADVAEDAYYAPAVQWAAENRITLGTGATTFDPKTNCTRAQIVVFLYRTGIG